MAWPEKLKPISITMIAALALGVVAYAFWPRPPGETEFLAQETLPQPNTHGGLEPQETEVDRIEPPITARNSRALGKAKASEIRERVNAQEPFPHDVLMDDYKADLWEDIQANPPEFETPGDPAIDADMAYRLYMYFGNCSVVPRSEHQVDRRLARVAERLENPKGRNLERLERFADRTFGAYELCSAIPPEVDPRMEAIAWMSEAVRLGHEIAQVQYYEKIMGFLMRPDRYTNNPPIAMKHPGLIEEFKATARFALSRALEKGHPEAYMAMSQAVLEGLIYPKDPVMAMAYLRVAELAAAQHRVILDRIGHHKSTISQTLDQEQLAEAEKMAQELLSGDTG